MLFPVPLTVPLQRRTELSEIRPEAALPLVNPLPGLAF